MIGRFWKGLAGDAANADAYSQLFASEIVRGLQGVDGFRGAYLFRRSQGDGVELMTLTLFDSLDGIRRFAGENYQLAVVTPEAQAVLSSADETAEHFDVLVPGEP